MTEYRVAFDFEVDFANGGGLVGHDFRLDIARDDIDDDELAEHIISDLGLLMVGAVRIRKKRILAEPHKRRTLALPSSSSASVVEGLELGVVGPDRAGLDLALLDGRPISVLNARGLLAPVLDWTLFVPLRVAGHVVLVDVDGTHQDCVGSPSAFPVLTTAAAAWLVRRGVCAVGFGAPEEAVGREAVVGLERLRDAGVPVLLGLCGLDKLPVSGARLELEGRAEGEAAVDGYRVGATLRLAGDG